MGSQTSSLTKLTPSPNPLAGAISVLISSTHALFMDKNVTRRLPPDRVRVSPGRGPAWRRGAPLRPSRRAHLLQENWPDLPTYLVLLSGVKRVTSKNKEFRKF